MNNLPTSIKSVGWIYTLLGILILFFSFRMIFAQPHTSVINEPRIFTSDQLLFLNLLLATFGLVVLTSGQGILRRNKIAYFTVLVIIIALFFTHPFGLPLIPINAFVVWKLIEHRRLFGI